MSGQGFNFPLTTADDAIARTGTKFLVYGGAGAGKTHMAKTTGDPAATLVISAEPGLMTLEGEPIPVAQVSNFKELKRVYFELKKGDHPFHWVIVDSISEVAEICLADEKRKSKDPRAAYGEMADTVISLIKAFRDLPYNVVMLCKMTSVDDDGRLHYLPKAPGRQIGPELPHLFDIVLALRCDRGPEGLVRYVQTARDHQYEAKDRSSKLAFTEPPDLAYLEAKIHAPRQEIAQ